MDVESSSQIRELMVEFCSLGCLACTLKVLNSLGWIAIVKQMGPDQPVILLIPDLI